MSEPSARARVRRNAGRGVYDRPTIDAILDAHRICHVSYVDGGEPRLIPTLYMRRGDFIYVHGNRRSALIEHLCAGGLACLSVMIVDGVVVARSGFHCSMNYRSVTVFGHGEEVADADKTNLLDAFVDALIPGHAGAVREASEQELAATRVARLPIDDCAAKVRTGPPIDDAADLDNPVWAGVLPLHLATGSPLAAHDLKGGIELPDYLEDYEFSP